MGKHWKQCQTLFFVGSKITADGDWNHEIKRRLLLGRKVMTNLDSILKSRDITLPTKVRLVKAMVLDRKSTRLNSSHHSISYAVFCLKKKNKQKASSQAR